MAMVAGRTLLNEHPPEWIADINASGGIYACAWCYADNAVFCPRDYEAGGIAGKLFSFKCDDCGTRGAWAPTPGLAAKAWKDPMHGTAWR